MRFSMDDLVRLNDAVVNAGPRRTEPADLDPVALKQMTMILEQAEVFSLDDPFDYAAHLAAYVSWVRPFGPSSDRTALLAAAVVLDLAKAKVPPDWTGGADLLTALRASGVGPGARSTAIRDWLGASTSSARP
jgi:hypothetical protein